MSVKPAEAWIEHDGEHTPANLPDGWVEVQSRSNTASGPSDVYFWGRPDHPSEIVRWRPASPLLP